MTAHTDVLFIHFIGLLFSPIEFSSNCWPWALDAFSGRFCVGVFVLALFGNYLILRGAHAKEVTYRAIVVVFSFGVIVGLLVVDAEIHKIDWNGFNTWFWIISSLFSGFIGLYWMSKSKKI